VHEWTAANGRKLNPTKSQEIVISRCRVDSLPPTLLIGSEVINFVPKMVLRSLRPHASHMLSVVRRRLVVSLIMPHIGYGGI
jgi:hypothetical protein